MTLDFSEFIGRKVLVNPGGWDNKSKRHLPFSLEEGETLIEDIQKKVGAVYTLRIFLPGVVAAGDYKADRVNVHIEKVADGSYEVTLMDLG